jgi:hypothetical protein
LNAAKYGLTPLVLEQQREVVKRVQRWMKGWTAVPAFYVDTPLVTSDQVYESDRCVTAAKLWMDMVSKVGARVVLVDSPDKISQRRLVKIDEKDTVGVLTISQVDELNRYAERRNLRVLWSGGIRAEQAFGLARLGVYGIFTTGSTARPIPVAGELAGDPATAASNEPTLPGVRRIHALVQAGFLSRALAKTNQSLVRSIEKWVALLLKDELESKKLGKDLNSLNEDMQQAWAQHWSRIK